MNIHFNISLDTFAGETPDGVKCVGLIFKDKDTKEEHGYPIPLDVAEDLGNEIIRLSKSL